MAAVQGVGVSGKILPFQPRKGVVDLSKREEMKRLILAGTDLETIASQLGYASGRAALVMATRWGLNTLRPESYIYKGRLKLYQPRSR